MKKIVSLLLIMVMCFFVASCTNDNLDPVATNSEKTYVPATNTTIDTTGFKVSIEESIFDELNCHIVLHYPVVSGLNDKEEEDLLNQKLYYYCYKIYKNKCLVSDDDVSFNYLTIDSAITYTDDDFFSALFSISDYSDDSTHEETFTFTINCLVSKSKILETKDFVVDYMTIRQAFLDGKFIQEYGLTTLLETLSYPELISNYYPEYDVFPYFYFEEEKLGMNINLAHVYGGYAGFTVPINEVIDYLNRELSFINNF